jgi:DNA-binding transcriptional MocR family regulator
MTSTHPSKETLASLKQEYLSQFESLKSKGLTLDMTRGKPGSEQLDLSNELGNMVHTDYRTPSGIDVRNYGGLDGIPEAKSLFAPVLDVDPDEVIVGGNSSLTMMYQYIDHAFHHGVDGMESAWKHIPDGPSFLCPVPGYDRHFSICEFLGIRMIPVPLTVNGPDIEVIEEHLKNDKSICGMWCVPKYSNPGGVVYGQECIESLAEVLTHTRPDFRLMWDNAYALHDLVENPAPLHSILSACKKVKTEDKVILFGSTSKITFAGAGVAFSGMTRKNLSSFIHYLSFQTIGPDKLNQLRHVTFFKNTENLKEHMKKHRDILQPRFSAVLEKLKSSFRGDTASFASWTEPKGGYFISVNTLPGLASEVVSLCNELGVKITPAGATFPYGKDPENTNIRLAPSFPSIEQISLAMEAFTTAVGLASTRKLLS